jgi:hypothetical protein
MRPVKLLTTAVLLAGLHLAQATPEAPDSTPIAFVKPDLLHLQKWHDSNGDTADPFWADDDNLYHFSCDGRGFGKSVMNLCLNKLTGPDLLQQASWSMPWKNMAKGTPLKRTAPHGRFADRNVLTAYFTRS